jgi:predicted nucleic acid-binding protein
MRRVFVDTSGFYAFLDGGDPFHKACAKLWSRAQEEEWDLITSSYVIHESWALIQARLGWAAVEDWLGALVPACEVIWIDERLHALGAARARQSRERRLSLTDCVSFEVMLGEGCREAIADDEHFRKYGFLIPE